MPSGEASNHCREVDHVASNRCLISAEPLHPPIHNPLRPLRLFRSTMASSSKMALQTFSIENDILEISPQDEIYRFDEAANKQINREAPWAQECVLFSPSNACYGVDEQG